MLEFILYVLSSFFCGVVPHLMWNNWHYVILAIIASLNNTLNKKYIEEIM